MSAGVGLWVALGSTELAFSRPKKGQETRVPSPWIGDRCVLIGLLAHVWIISGRDSFAAVLTGMFAYHECRRGYSVMIMFKLY